MLHHLVGMSEQFRFFVPGDFAKRIRYMGDLTVEIGRRGDNILIDQMDIVFDFFVCFFKCGDIFDDEVVTA